MWDTFLEEETFKLRTEEYMAGGQTKEVRTISMHVAEMRRVRTRVGNDPEGVGRARAGKD